MYGIYNLVASIIKTFEPDSKDEFVWLDAIFGMLK